MQSAEDLGLPQPNDDDSEHIIMAVNIGPKSIVGCAYYIAGEERLLCMEEIGGGDHDFVERLKIDIQPTTVILSPRADSLAQITTSRSQRPTSFVASADDQLPLPYETEIRPLADFNYEGALNKIIALASSGLFCDSNGQFFVPDDPDFYEEENTTEIGFTQRRGRLLQLSTRLNLDDRMSIGCAGAVLGYLQRKRASTYLPVDPRGGHVFRVALYEMFSLRHTMLVNADTLASLQVIEPRVAGSAPTTGPTKSKEAPLSIHALFHVHAKSPQGKSRLRQAFLRPSLDVDHINSRLDFVSVLIRSENQQARQELSKCLGKIKDMRNTTTLLRKGIERGKQQPNAFKGSVWLALWEFCRHSIAVAESLHGVIGADRLCLWSRAVGVLDRGSLQKISEMVHETVDFDGSAEAQRTVINCDIYPRLDELKRKHDKLDEVLTETAREIDRSLGLNIELNVIYLPHLGYHISIPVDPNTHEPEINWRALDWEQMFTADSRVYFKDATMRVLDEDIGDIYANICDYEIEIAHDLAQKVLEHEKFLIEASDICGELDCNLAFVHSAYEHRLTRPKIIEHNVINIEKGRHLLQEKSVPSFVPNDTFILGGGGEDEHAPVGPSMLLLTGPNYSGKSVYQKQVALAVYMAHIGSFVPAESATIGITDKIFTRLATRETVSKVQSAFMIDMQQIAMALNSCTRKSLIVIDEFGKGTDTCDGAGLAAGVFLHLLSLNTQAPKALVATHFHEIFETNLFGTLKNISFAHMEVRVENADERVTEQQSRVSYLYNLQLGCSDLSYGTQCAAMNGIPEEVVERALDLSRRARKGEDLVSQCSALTVSEAAELEAAEVAAELFLDQNFDQQMTENELQALLDAMIEPASKATEELDI
ncbi:hypothetical protein LTS17_008183 [Exophiala oligosperma]